MFKIIEEFPNYEINENGEIRNRKTNRIMKQQLSKHGYYTVDLSKYGKATNLRVHRLVAITFIPNPDNKEMVDHINRIKTDNSVVNLRWATAKENSMNREISNCGKIILILNNDKWEVNTNGILKSYSALEEALELIINKYGTLSQQEQRTQI